MIRDHILATVRDTLMDAMTLLYVEDRDDELAQYLAANIVAIYEQIDLELMERAWAR